MKAMKAAMKSMRVYDIGMAAGAVSIFRGIIMESCRNIEKSHIPIIDRDAHMVWEYTSPIKEKPYFTVEPFSSFDIDNNILGVLKGKRELLDLLDNDRKDIKRSR